MGWLEFPYYWGQLTSTNCRLYGELESSSHSNGYCSKNFAGWSKGDSWMWWAMCQSTWLITLTMISLAIVTKSLLTLECLHLDLSMVFSQASTTIDVSDFMDCLLQLYKYWPSLNFWQSNMMFQISWLINYIVFWISLHQQPCRLLRKQKSTEPWWNSMKNSWTKLGLENMINSQQLLDVQQS